MAELPAWLNAVIAEVRLHAEAALLRRLDAGSGFADSRVPSQIYLRDAAANSRIAGGTLRPQGTHRAACAEVAQAVSQASVTSARLVMESDSRLVQLVRRLGIDPVGAGLLGAAVAYAVDLDTRELMHALAPRRKPALYLDTCVDVLDVAAVDVLAAISGNSALRRGRVVVVDIDTLDGQLELVSGAYGWLLGDDSLQPPLAGLCELIPAEVDLGVMLPPSTTEALDGLIDRVRGDREVAVVVRGPRGSGRRAAAHRLAHALNRPLLTIPIPALVAAEKRFNRSLLAAALAAARWRDAVPYLADADQLYDESGAMAPEHADAIAGVPGLIAVASTGRGGHLELGRPQLIVSLARAELEDRERAWKHALSRGGPVADAPELAARYVIGPGAIADVVSEATRYAAAAQVSLDRDALEGAVGRWCRAKR